MARDLNLATYKIGKRIAVGLTPTADGTGKGVVPATADVVNIIAVADANHWITLPPPVIDKRITIYNPTGTGFEIRTNAPATVGINGGVSAAGESALAATALRIELVCISLTNWIGHSYVAAGTESAVQVAAD